METFPFVSVVTPTYNRRRFIPWIIECYKLQTYPKDRMEWIILDDGQDSVEDLFTGSLIAGIPNVKYIRLKGEKMLIGAKRNMLNKEAKGDIIVAMDDDDFYMPERIAHVVHRFRQSPKIQLAGSSEIYMYYSDVKEIYKMGPYGPRHATNGTMAWTKEYAGSHRYDETVTFAEEKSFLDDYKNPMIQLDPMKVMLVMSHTENTYDKKKFRDQPNNPFVKKSGMKLRDFIKNAKIRAFFQSA